MRHAFDLVFDLYLTFAALYLAFWVLILWDRFKKIWKNGVKAMLKEIGVNTPAARRMAHTGVAANALYAALVWPYSLIIDIANKFTYEEDRPWGRSKR